MISRVFAVLAAVMAVAAFTLLVLAPDGMTLIQGLANLSPTLPRRLQHATLRAFGMQTWVKLMIPLLVRPVWLIPACLGLLSAGVAASLGGPTQSPRSTRTRL